MAQSTNNAEGGTNTTTVTTGNSGGASGNAFSAVNAGITFSSTQKAHGSLAYAFAGTAATFNVVQLDSASGTTTGWALRFYVYLTGYPSAETTFCAAQTAGGVGLAGLNLTATGGIKLTRAAGALAGTFTNTLSLNTWYRLSMWGGVSATVAPLNAAIYALDNATAIESLNLTNQNTGSTVMGRAVYGKLTQAPGMTTYYIDDIAQDPDTASEIGPVANTPPTVDAGTDQSVSAGATVNLSATANDPDGTIATYAWTWDYHPTASNIGTNTGITNPATATPSVTAGSAGYLSVLRCTVTDNGGVTASDTVEVRVPTSGDLTPLPGYPPTGTGTWSNVGGAASEGAALADASDATYVESSAATSSEVTRRYRLTPSTPRGSANIVVRVGQDVAGTIVVSARLFENATQREEFTPVTVTTTPTDRTLTLASGTISAITTPGWETLYLELGVHT